MTAQEKRAIKRQQREEAKRKREVEREFSQWKASLCQLVEKESSIAWEPGGGYQFIFPRTIMRLVWKVSIKERQKYLIQEAQKRGESLSFDEAGELAAKDLLQGVEEEANIPRKRAEAARRLVSSATPAEIDVLKKSLYSGPKG